MWQKILAFFAHLAVILGIQQTPIQQPNQALPDARHLAPATSTLIYCCLPDVPFERNCQPMSLPDCIDGTSYTTGKQCLAVCDEPITDQGTTDWQEEAAPAPQPTEEDDSSVWCCDNRCDAPIPASQCVGTVFGHQLDCLTSCGIPQAWKNGGTCPDGCSPLNDGASCPGTETATVVEADILSGFVRFAAKLAGGTTRCCCPASP